MNPHRLRYRSIGDQMRDMDLARSNRDLAAEIGCHPDTVQQNRHRIAAGHVFRSPRGPWNDERIEMVKRLWADGKSASQIAIQLGGVTRNAVIGKVMRLGLAGRPTTSRKRSLRPRKVRLAPRPAPASSFANIRRDGMPIPTPAEADIPRVSFAALNEDGKRHCKWPCLDSVSNVPQTSPMFCGADPVPGLPYCRDHALRAFPPVRVREPFAPHDPDVMRVRREKETAGA